MLPAKVAYHLPDHMTQKQQSPFPDEESETDAKKEDAQDILLLFRILLKNSPPDHNCKTCPHLPEIRDHRVLTSEGGICSEYRLPPAA